MEEKEFLIPGNPVKLPGFLCGNAKNTLQHFLTECGAMLDRYHFSYNKIDNEHFEFFSETIKSLCADKGEVISGSPFEHYVSRHRGAFYKNYQLLCPSLEKMSMPFPIPFPHQMKTLRQMARDWSDEGHIERQQSYHLILQCLLDLYPSNQRDKRVLIPCGGLGRLAYDISEQGFICEYNDINPLAAALFELNLKAPQNSLVFCPFAGQTCHRKTHDSHIRLVRSPSVKIEGEPVIHKTCGNFETIYLEPRPNGPFNAVVTCFALDSTPNVLQFIRCVATQLAEGDHWINFGPLSYFYSGESEEEPILELSLEEIREAINLYFEITQEDQKDNIRYCNDNESLLKFSFRCVLFVARRNAHTEHLKLRGTC